MVALLDGSEGRTHCHERESVLRVSSQNRSRTFGRFLATPHKRKSPHSHFYSTRFAPQHTFFDFLRIFWHVFDDIRITGFDDGETGNPIEFTTGGTQIDIVAGIVMYTTFSQHRVVFNFGFL